MNEDNEPPQNWPGVVSNLITAVVVIALCLICGWLVHK